MMTKILQRTNCNVSYILYWWMCNTFDRQNLSIFYTLALCDSLVCENWCLQIITSYY